jgi:hypothetical protein
MVMSIAEALICRAGCWLSPAMRMTALPLISAC